MAGSEVCLPFCWPSGVALMGSQVGHPAPHREGRGGVVSDNLMGISRKPI